MGGPALGALPARYRLLRPLGQGGEASVWLAEDSVLERRVAIKRGRRQLPPGAAASHEARIGAGIVHPHVLPVLDAGVDDAGFPFLMVPYVRGPTLRGAIRRCHQADPAWPLRGLIGSWALLCAAVAHAHRRGVVHGDLSAGNVLLGPSLAGAPREVFLIDWGLARGPRAAARRGGPMGTPSTMAPELARGAVEIGPLVDIYALGAILFHVLGGQRYLAGLSRAQALRALAHRPPLPRPPDPRPGGLRALVLACMDEDPARRPPRVEELEAAAAEFLRRAERADAARARLAEARVLRARAEALRAPLAAARAQRQVEDDLLYADLIAGPEPDRPVSPELGAALPPRAAAAVRRAAALVAEAEAEAALGRANRAARRALVSGEGAGAAAEGAGSGRSPWAPPAPWWAPGPAAPPAEEGAPGRLGLALSRPAAVELQRWSHAALAFVPAQTLEPTTQVDLLLRPGSWRLRLRCADGGRWTWPFVVPPGGRAGARGPDGAPAPLWLPGAAEQRPGERFIPAGWQPLGGDGLVEGALGQPEGERYLGGFFITVEPEALDEGGGHARPATAAALAEARGGRLPTELEWARAVQGVDRRPFPWGWLVDPRLVAVSGAELPAEGHGPRPPDPCAFPLDAGPFDLGLAVGGRRCVCAPAAGLALPVGAAPLRGAGPAGGLADARIGARRWAPLDRALPGLALRVVRPAGP